MSWRPGPPARAARRIRGFIITLTYQIGSTKLLPLVFSPEFSKSKGNGRASQAFDLHCTNIDSS